MAMLGGLSINGCNDDSGPGCSAQIRGHMAAEEAEAIECRPRPERTDSTDALPRDYGTSTIFCTAPKIAKNGLHILQGVFDNEDDPGGSHHLSDAVLVSIDFENINTIRTGFPKNGNCQVGIAILDTKLLSLVAPEELMETYSFATGSPSYIAKASDKFIFGRTHTVGTSDLANCVMDLLPPDRNVILVGHGIKSDLQALQSLGFRFPGRIRAVLDSLRIASEVFGFWAGTLRDLLVALECPFNRLHCAGNDANFAVRALLLLTIRSSSNRQRGHDGRMLNILCQVSTDPIPDWVDPELRALRRREQRRERNRRYQSKEWDMEKQDQIRASRQHRREQSIDGPVVTLDALFMEDEVERN